MNLQEAAAVAKQRVAEMAAPSPLRNVRLEHFLYDDHLAVWSLTIAFAFAEAPDRRGRKLVRVSEADKSVLSVADA